GFMNQLNGNGPVAQEAKRAEEQVTAKLTETKNAAGNDFKRALNAAAGAVNTVAGAAGADPGATKVA
ncbi:MAG: hypothetical protein VKP62_08125, partial [Candidatus Sericytochromatia bacterium]|nr:hypothetical protein [Candidatus Sericytochromatia bacterium]